MEGDLQKKVPAIPSRLSVLVFIDSKLLIYSIQFWGLIPSDDL